MKILSKFVIKNPIKELYWREIDEKDKDIKFTFLIKYAKKFNTELLAEQELENLPIGVYQIIKIYKV